MLRFCVTCHPQYSWLITKHTEGNLVLSTDGRRLDVLWLFCETECDKK